jgi:hypothetical protein
MNGFEEISSEFVVGFIGRQIQLIEAVKRKEKELESNTRNIR